MNKNLGNHQKPTRGNNAKILIVVQSCSSSSPCSVPLPFIFQWLIQVVQKELASRRALSSTQRRFRRFTDNTGKSEVCFEFEVESPRVKCQVIVNMFDLEKALPAHFPRMNLVAIYSADSQADGGVRSVRGMLLFSIFLPFSMFLHTQA